MMLYYTNVRTSLQSIEKALSWKFCGPTEQGELLYNSVLYYATLCFATQKHNSSIVH